MPQKLNKAGKMQDYIPKGNGDASGEYGTSKGTNKNFTASDKKKTEANVITENKSVVVDKKEKSLKEKMNENAKNYTEENYNGHAIMPDLLDGYTVDYEGDEVWFKTKDEAKAFIDKEFGKKESKANVIDGDLTGKKEEKDYLNGGIDEITGWTNNKETRNKIKNDVEKQYGNTAINFKGNKLFVRYNEKDHSIGLYGENGFNWIGSGYDANKSVRENVEHLRKGLTNPREML